MQLTFVLCIVLSAFLHAFYNFLMKKNAGDYIFLNGMFLVAFLISLPVTFFSGGFADVPWRNTLYVFGAAFFYSLYQIFANKSYQQGGITTNYPLTVLSPLFVPIWAFFLLSEKITVLTGLGILVTVIGAVVVQMKSFSLSELREILVIKKDRAGAHFALAASLVYSFGAIFDKAKITTFSISAYLSIITFFMCLCMAGHLLLRQRKDMFHYFLRYWRAIMLGGVVLYGSFLFFRLALQRIEVSVAIPIRLVSIVFVILFGVFFLKEAFGTSKLAAVVFIIAGIVLISMGMK